LASIHESLGHGWMYYPWVWHDKKRIDPSKGLKGANWGANYAQPDVVCQSPDHCAQTSKTGVATDFFTNHTFIPGEPTLSNHLFSKGRRFQWIDGKKAFHPWAAPGSAPIYGQGCGLNGGNPYPHGCHHPNVDTDPYGTCCAFGGPGCGGYVGGRSALEHYAEGAFGDVATTEWKRGKPATVYWTSGAGHQGGYAYRLCKIPEGGVTAITEKCFQDGHLSFVGKSWVYEGIRKTGKPTEFDPNNWKEVCPERTRVGTTPPNSEWQKIPVPKDEKKGNYGFMDRVKIPADLETGDYILSYRWDCQKSAQIWSSCANIRIV